MLQYRIIELIYSLIIITHLCDSTEIIGGDLVKQLSSGSLLQGKMINTQSGSVVYAYLGIPYAEAPIGQLRFNAPVTRQKWEGVLDASYYKVSCIFNNSDASRLANIEFMAEDCLHLNVFTSKNCTSDKQCPVLIYIDGGLYNGGSPITISPQAVADTWASNNLIVVTLSYRLGAFGFLDLHDGTNMVLNAGLLDQIEALKWVQREIGQFGGNQNQITMVGEGTGAINADQLAISPLISGLIQQIVLFDGVATTLPCVNNETNYASSMQLAQLLNCSVKTGENTVITETLNCLRLKTSEEILGAQKLLEIQGNQSAFNCPSLDGNIFPNPINDLIKKRVPMRIMVGNDENPVQLFRLALDGGSTKVLGVMCQFAIKYRGLNTSQTLLDKCVNQYSDETSQRRTDLVNDITVFAPIFEIVQYNTLNGGISYLFEVQGNTSLMKDMLRDATIQFAKTGDPSVSNIKWEPYSTKQNNFLLISNLTGATNSIAYHNNSVYFWEIEATRISEGNEQSTYSTMTPDVIPSESNTTWNIEQLFANINQLIDESTKLNQKYENTSVGVYEQWKNDLQNLSKQLNESLLSLQKAVESLKAEAEKQEAKELSVETTTPTTAPKIPITSPEWIAPSTTTTTTTPLPIWIDIQKTDDTVSISVKVPKEAWNQLANVTKIINEVLQKLESYNGSTVIQSNTISQWGTNASNIEPLIRQSLINTLYPDIVIEDGKLVIPTVPMITVVSTWFDSIWFWIIHIVGVVIFIIIIIIAVILYINLRKRKQYESLN